VTEIDAQLAASLSRRFRLVRRLGEGGMGAVFLAEQIAVGNCPVALKILSREGFALSCCSSLVTCHSSLPFTNPAKPMTARPTSPWNFWKANPSAKP
jgi:serine/threonine protein kinase